MTVPRRRNTSGPASPAAARSSIGARIQAGDDRLGDALGLVRTFYRDRNDARFLGRVVVATDEQSIADEDHLLEREAEDVSQLPNAVGLVDAGFGHIDRGGAAHSDRELRKQPVEDRLDLLSLGIVRVPLVLLVEGRRLPQRRERDLASPIFDLLSPELLGFVAGLQDRLLERTLDPGLFVRGEVLGIDLCPSRAIS